ncbi:c-type cytochrome [Oceanibaculum nanhaiense]|jgi:mono/diheme cytochrome c family protein|uniref:c-type cytochrome n=1 Tax=Oceanibaculum nanhaiense TaxID=1909734 RepID=UPI000A3654C6|nr:cytochrome c [Oceanibaculum nanhaiense]
MKRTRWIALGVTLLAAAGGGAAWQFAAPSPASGAIPPIDPGNTEQVALGRDIYAAQCAACHGTRLEGQPDWQVRLPDGRLPAPPHDASGHTWHHPDSQLFAMTKYGIEPFAPKGYESDMPAFRDILTDTEIAAALAYIKSRWPQDIRQRHDALNRTAKK